MILTVNLIEKFYYAYNNKWGYILNTWHTMWSQSLQNGKVSYMKNKYGADWKNSEKAKKDDSYTAAMYGSRLPIVAVYSIGPLKNLVDICITVLILCGISIVPHRVN